MYGVGKGCDRNRLSMHIQSITGPNQIAGSGGGGAFAARMSRLTDRYNKTSTMSAAPRQRPGRANWQVMPSLPSSCPGARSTHVRTQRPGAKGKSTQDKNTSSIPPYSLLDSYYVSRQTFFHQRHSWPKGASLEGLYATRSRSRGANVG